MSTQATAVKERPILFSSSMVKAILEGRKTQTRRVVKPQPSKETTSAGTYRGGDSHGQWEWLSGDPKDCETWGVEGDTFSCPYGVPGDQLWVKESWWPAIDGESIGKKPGWHEWAPDPKRPVPDDGYNEPEAIMYKATDDFHPSKWRNAMFMPRWASRILLEIVDVRVERVQEISPEDTDAEGIKLTEHYDELWDSINAKRGFGWEKNPWVWVVEFRRLP